MGCVHWALIAMPLACVGCDAVFGTGGEAADAAITGPARLPITIQQTFGLLDDFPVHVVVPPDPTRAALLQLGTPVFTDPSGVALAHQIVELDLATGLIEAWVRVPTLGTGATSIELRFGVAVDSPPETDTWPPQVEGAWHMAGLDAEEHDATANRLVARAATPGATPATAVGIAGSARSYDGVDDAMCVATNGADVGADSFTATAWVLVTSSIGAFDAPLAKGGSSPQTAGFSLFLGSGPWSAGFADGTAGLTLQVTAEAVALGAWHHLVMVVDRVQGQARSYLDAQLATAVPFTLGSLSGVSRLCLGSDQNFFHGLLDEPRIYRTALPVAWIEAEHANLSEPDRFVTLGMLSAL